MAKATKTTAVSVVTEEKAETLAKIEQMKNSIPELIDLQKKRLKELEGDNEDKNISLDIEYDGTPISSITKVSELVELEASLVAREAAYTATLRKRGLEGKVKAWAKEGKDINHWTQVLDKAYSQLVNKAEIALIKTRVKELEQHLSEEAKVKATLEKLIQEGTALLD